MGSKEQLHFIFIPYMAPGHMMPMIDIARLCAAQGVSVTIITTTKNALRFKTTIDRDIESGSQIKLEILRFPCTEAGLPQGYENLSYASTTEMGKKIFHAIGMLKPDIQKLIRDHRPNCIVSDYLFHWTVETAVELGIPRLAFSGSGFFNLCVSNSIERYEPHKDIESENQPFVAPYLPDKIEITSAQLPDIVKGRTDFSAVYETLKAAERKSFGVLINSFSKLEPAYVDHFRNVIGIKAWHVGPVSLYNRHENDKAERGDKSTISKHECSNWLDSKESKSVLYICFGSLTRFSKAQITEIATALEESTQSFIWVLGKVLKTDKEERDEHQEWWLPEGFENRIQERMKGLIIKGWAPQVLILEHWAIGGFLTHCGWNSILEGVSAKVPMITWPVFADQFYNEKLITQVLKIGISVDNQVWKAWATDDSPLVGRNNIKAAISAVMSNGKERDGMNERVNTLGNFAHKTVAEDGSSYGNLKAMIEEIRTYSPTHL